MGTSRSRTRIRWCLVIASVAPILAACGPQSSGPASVQPAGRAKPVPQVIDCSFDKPAVRPPNMTLACADLGVQVEKITWNSWSSDRAEGDGIERDNTCTPTCAAGHYITKPVHIVLSDAVQPANLYGKATTVDAGGKSFSAPLVAQR